MRGHPGVLVLAAVLAVCVARDARAEPGLRVRGDVPADNVRFEALVGAAAHSSPTVRRLLAELAADPDPRHAVDVVVVRDRRGVFVDSLASGLVDLEDLERFPSADDDDLERNEVTREEQLVHLVAERRHLRRALTRGAASPALLDAAHAVGVLAQNQYRRERGQVEVVDATFHEVDGRPGVAVVEFALADGTLSVVLTSRGGQIERIVPPFRPAPDRVRLAKKGHVHRTTL